jgi:hypothetical protein
MRLTWKFGFPIACTVLTCLLAFVSPANGQVLLRGDLGFSGATGDVGDDLIGPGFLFGGGVYFAVDPSIYIGGGLDIVIHGGQEVDGGAVSVDFTDGAAVVTFEAGGLIYILPPENPARPFMGATIGRGALAWSYSDEAEWVTGEDSDGVGFFFFAPTAGIAFQASENLQVGGAARFVFTSYDDETTENWRFDLDGGHFIQLRAYLGILL